MILLSILSFIFDGIFSLLVEKNSLLLSLFSLTSLIVIYPFIIKKHKLIYFALSLGFCYDIIYTQTPLLYTILFVILGLIILLYFRFIPYNIISSIICTTIIIFMYRILSYTCVILINDYKFSWDIVFRSFYSSLISNLVYLIIFSIILKLYYNRKGKKKSYNY
jgi:rod shape-determining protein MreD